MRRTRFLAIYAGVVLAIPFGAACEEKSAAEECVARAIDEGFSVIEAEQFCDEK